MFRDRKEACDKLSGELTSYCGENCIIIGIPRGGAIIAECIAKKLKKPWDIIVPRKIGAPANMEVAVGAVTQDGEAILNDEIIKYFNITDEYINNQIEKEIKEIKRRLIEYRGSLDFPDICGRTVILVDDGIATGYTVAAAVNSIKKQQAEKIIVAVPVASVEGIDMLKKYVGEILCIEVPKPFISVGSSYINFEQNVDEEIIDLFKQKSNKRYI